MYSFLKGAFLAFFITGLCVFFYGSTSEAQDYNWTSNNDLRFDILQDNLSYAQLPTTSSDYNRDCTKRTLTLRYSQLFSIFPSQDVTTCTIQTAQGIYGNRYLQLNGANKAGILDLGGNNMSLIGGDNSSSYIVGNNSAVTGVYVNFLKNLTTKTSNNLDGSITHTLVSNSSIISINNSLNQRLTMMPDTLSFSSNGKWAVFDSSSYGHVRMNMEDGTILSFGIQSTYGMGYIPGYQTAISSDGRYAIFSSSSGSTNVYDLTDCPTSQPYQSYLKKCKSREISKDISTKTNFGPGMMMIRFTSDRSFTYFNGKLQSGSVIYKQFRITMGDVPLFGMNYLALGDSYASGEGSYNYKPFTDISDNNCHNSMSSYPFVIAKKLSQENYNSIACSGATTYDIFNELGQERNYKGQFLDGLTQGQRDDNEINDIITSFIPGKITQQTFVGKLTPEAITVSVGGNDIGFADKIKSCLYKDLDTTCFNTYEDRAEVLLEINNAIPKIENTLRNLKINNNRVYVIGYPSIIADGGNCAFNVKFNNSEVDFANKLTELLNNAIYTAVKRSGVYYVDVNNVLEGHRLCETKSSDIFVHGLTTTRYKRGDRWTWGIAQESFHPKVQAQALYADAILNQTNNLTKPMPSPDPSAVMAIPQSNDSYWHVAKTNRSIYIPHYFSYLMPAVQRNDQQISNHIDHGATNLKPDGVVSVELHSSPITIGTTTTDSSGNLDFNITIPQNIEPGYHSLHLYGQNIFGDPVDIYDYFLVESSDTSDVDGNGRIDSDQGCLFIQSTMIDSDQDGINDACDGEEDPLPIPIDYGNQLNEPPNLQNNIVSDPKNNLSNGSENTAGNEQLNNIEQLQPAQNQSNLQELNNPTNISAVRATINSDLAVVSDISSESQTEKVLGVNTYDSSNSSLKIEQLNTSNSYTDNKYHKESNNLIYYLLIGIGALFISGALVFRLARVYSR